MAETQGVQLHGALPLLLENLHKLAANPGLSALPLNQDYSVTPLQVIFEVLAYVPRAALDTGDSRTEVVFLEPATELESKWPVA